MFYIRLKIKYSFLSLIFYARKKGVLNFVMNISILFKIIEASFNLNKIK